MQNVTRTGQSAPHLVFCTDAARRDVVLTNSRCVCTEIPGSDTSGLGEADVEHAARCGVGVVEPVTAVEHWVFLFELTPFHLS